METRNRSVVYASAHALPSRNSRYPTRGTPSLVTIGVFSSHAQNIRHAAITPGAVSERNPSSTTRLCVAGCVKCIATN